MYQVWLWWVARPEFARAECLSCQSQPSLFRAKESPLNIGIIAKGNTSVIFFCFKRYEHQLSPVVGIIVLCCVRGSNGHMGEYLMRALITIELNIHCLTSVVGAFALSVFLVHLETLLLLFSKQQEYLLSARSFVYCLSILGWFGYLPICSQYSLCFANPQGFNSFSPGKYHCITFSTHRRTLSKYDAWRTKNFKKIECSPTGSPREIRYPAAILKSSFPLPPCCGIHLDQSR